jgi:hypothetical protein
MKDDAANQQEEFLDQILEPISASMAMEACIMWHHELVDLCVNQNLCIENNKVHAQNGVTQNTMVLGKFLANLINSCPKHTGTVLCITYIPYISNNS